MTKTRVQPIDAPPSYTLKPGPIANANRKCRDLFFLLLFGVFWAGMIVVAILAINNGNPQRLLYGTDSYGNICGINNTATNSSKLDLTDRKSLFYFNPLDSSNTALKICVNVCPNSTAVPTFKGQNYICDYSISPISDSDLLNQMNNKKCAALVYTSKAVVNRCIPSGNITALLLANYPSTTNSALDPASLISGTRDTVQKLLSDVQYVWPYILGAVGIALIVCFIWMVLLRYFAGVITWVTLILGQLVITGFAVYMYFEWQSRLSSGTATSDEQIWERNIALGLFVAAAAIASLMLIMIIFLRTRLRIAVQIIKEASRAIGSMKMIIFYPIVTFVGMAGLLAYYLVIAAYIATAEEPNSLGSISFNLSVPILRYLQWYHLFGLLWTFAFLTGINQTVIAGSIATWYWTLDKKNLPRFVVAKAFYRTIRYSMGSIALGSLLVAIVQFIRIIFLYLERQLKGNDNRIIKFLFACLQCCFACIERFMKFISKNAYIQIAVYGYSFFKGARTAFELLTRNAFRLFAVDFVAGFVMFLSKLCITTIMGFASYVVFKSIPNIQLIAAPVCVVVVESWMIASAFFGVHKMAIDTIFLSFCEDVERNDGSPQKPFYMPQSLQAITSLRKGKKNEEA